ncbi:50S ribosomal protein L9 [Candidatus Berkelbacteria bacterium]|nr:50S ribosomal protein L9 [Candidatus Berkelbacteria bacterium]
MKVILTKPVELLGTIGETKEVKPGYARNFLFPQRLAIIATDPRAKKLRAQYHASASQVKQERALIGELADQWRNQTFTVKARASADGTLYGSVGLKELRKALGREDLDFELPILKTVGRHEISLKFRSGIVIPVVVVIEPEAAR